MNSLKKVLGPFHERLINKEKARDKVITFARDIVSDSAKAIRLMHQVPVRHSEVNDLIKHAKGENHKIAKILKNYPDLFVSAQDAQKELVEAIVFQILTNHNNPGTVIPGSDILDVGDSAYLNGLGEVIGELAREMSDSLIEGKEIDFAKEKFQWMKLIFDSIVEFTHYRDAITGNLRRTVDIYRGVIDKSRSALLSAILQERIQKENKELRTENKELRKENQELREEIKKLIEESRKVDKYEVK